MSPDLDQKAHDETDTTPDQSQHRYDSPCGPSDVDAWAEDPWRKVLVCGLALELAVDVSLLKMRMHAMHAIAHVTVACATCLVSISLYEYLESAFIVVIRLLCCKASLHPRAKRRCPEMING